MTRRSTLFLPQIFVNEKWPRSPLENEAILYLERLREFNSLYSRFITYHNAGRRDLRLERRLAKLSAQLWKP